MSCHGVPCFKLTAVARSAGSETCNVSVHKGGQELEPAAADARAQTLGHGFRIDQKSVRTLDTADLERG